MSNVVLAMRTAVDQLGLPKPDHHRDYTGHSFRVSGAHLLASVGLDVVMIQLLARWGI